MKLFQRLLATLGVAIIVSLLPLSSVWAYYSSPVDVDGDGYIRFGNDEYPQFSDNGLILEIVHESISHSWVDLTMTMWGPLVDQRQIDKFIVLANGKIVEEFYPQLVEVDGVPQWSSFYQIKVSVSELIGSTVYFQVVAVDVDTNDNGSVQYAVAWSDVTDEISMDPLPVKDIEAIAVLYAILQKLQDLASLLSQMLQELKDQTRPSQQKLDELYNAVSGLLDKMPMQQVADQLDQLNDALQDSRNGLASPGSVLILGGQVDLLPGVPGGEVMFMDLTPWRDQVLLFRSICQAAVWIWFFYMLFKWVTPKPEV